MPLSATERLVCDVAAIALRGGFATEFLARLVTGERSMRYVGSVVSPLDLGAVLLDVGEQTTLDLSRSSSSSR